MRQLKASMQVATDQANCITPIADEIYFSKKIFTHVLVRIGEIFVFYAKIPVLKGYNGWKFFLLDLLS